MILHLLFACSDSIYLHPTVEPNVQLDSIDTTEEESFSESDASNVEDTNSEETEFYMFL